MMHGVGRSSGAITIVNALSTGVGAAVAVDLGVVAEVTLSAVRDASPGALSLQPDSDSPIVRASLLAALRKYAPGTELNADLRIRSDVPPARGLKSSSAVSAAVIGAVAEANGRSAPPEEVARLSADVAQSIGQSATGAFDDALAATRGGLVVVDNAHRDILRTDSFDSSWHAVLWIPRGEHSPSTAWVDRFLNAAAEGRAAAEAAQSGSYVVAMNRNTELVERLVGYEYRPLREELRRQGAIASGVSGMGPTLAAIVEEPHIRSVLGALPRGTATVLTTSFRPPGRVTDRSRR